MLAIVYINRSIASESAGQYRDVDTFRMSGKDKSSDMVQFSNMQEVSEAFQEYNAPAYASSRYLAPIDATK